jgi:hypothetical protein
LWYAPKSEASSATLISKANDESSFEKREQVYKENRKELITQFRYLKGATFSDLIISI